MYFVCVNGQPQSFNGHVLTFCEDNVRLFPTYEVAEGAAKNTLRIAKEGKYDGWAIVTHGYQIFKVIAEQIKMSDENSESKMELRPEIRKFAEAMERKLCLNDWKGGWKDESELYLLRRLLEEIAELVGALHQGGDLGSEAADVANVAMMIADVAG